VFGRDEAGRPYHEITFRVTVLDTDIYNLSWERYLPWVERNGTELNHALGLSVARMKEQGAALLVVAFEVNYKQAAFLDDIVKIRSTIEKVGGASISYHHQFFRDQMLLVESYGSLVWVDMLTQRPARVPDWARAAIGLVLLQLELARLTRRGWRYDHAHYPRWFVAQHLVAVRHARFGDHDVAGVSSLMSPSTFQRILPERRIMTWFWRW